MPSHLMKLFFEIVQMMGMRGYNIHPFKFIIDNYMKNERFTELGQLDKIIEFDENLVIEHLINYRTTNFGIGPENFKGERMKISMIFDNPITGMRTLVLVSNETEGITSKDIINDYISRVLRPITKYKTNGLSIDPFLKNNKVNAIFILPSGVSPFSKSFLNEMSTIILMTESEILNRCYDSVIQSHIRTVPPDEKMSILESVGLNGSRIPSINSANDSLCKILDLQKDHLMISTRTSIASEETITNSIFLRNIN
jgi:DNA-directed RNA polymerase subunit H (RpoH/RPB5)